MKGLLLTRAEGRTAVLSFLIKIGLFWLAELVVCQLDQDRIVCRWVGRGFLPCSISFVVMDFVVLPRVRRWLRR